MAKVFEDIFSEIQADMISICLEYVHDEADFIYVYCSNEDGIIAAHCFFKKGGKIYKKHQVNQIKNSLSVSIERQKGLLQVLSNDIEKIESVCTEFGRDIPTEIKLEYNVKNSEMNGSFKYDLVYSNDPVKTVDDIAEEWFKQLLNNKTL